MEKRKTEVDRTSGKPEQEGLLKYMLENGMTQFHVVKHGEEYLKEHGFSELKLEDKWSQDRYICLFGRGVEYND